jgi:hypothetical protein
MYQEPEYAEHRRWVEGVILLAGIARNVAQQKAVHPCALRSGQHRCRSGDAPLKWLGNGLPATTVGGANEDDYHYDREKLSLVAVRSTGWMSPCQKALSLLALIASQAYIMFSCQRRCKDASVDRVSDARETDVRGILRRVTDGARTRDLRSHNPMLYLLSYGHHARRGFYQRKVGGQSVLCARLP